MQANVFFEVEGLVHVTVESDEPRDFDALAWAEFSKFVNELPPGFAIGEAKVKLITEPVPEKKETKGKDKEVVTPDVPFGTYL